MQHGGNPVVEAAQYNKPPQMVPEGWTGREGLDAPACFLPESNDPCRDLALVV